MLEELISKILPPLIHIFELMGIIILCVGGFKAFYNYIKSLISKKFYPVKHQFATSMATALEFKLGAEILKTVLIKSIDELIILGSIFLLRVLMTFVITWEIKQDKNNSQNKEK